MQNNNALMAQLNNMAADSAACCCETQRLIERGFADTNYNMATQACDTRRAIADSTRDIIDSNNAGVRSILDFLTQDKISTLQAENQHLNLLLLSKHKIITCKPVKRTLPYSSLYGT